MQRIKSTEIQFFLLFCVKLVLWHSDKNVGWGCLITGCWEIWLGQRGKRQEKTWGDCIMRSFMVSTPRQTLLGWWRRMGRERHATRIEERIGASGIWWGNLREEDYLEGVDIHRNTKWFLKKTYGRIGPGWSDLGYGIMVVSCKYGDELTRFIKFEEFPD